MSSGAKLIILLLGLLVVVGVVAIVLVSGLLLKTKAGSPPSATTATTGAATAPSEGPAGAALERVRSRGQLRVGMDTGNPAFAGNRPMYFQNTEGQQDGFDYQLAARIAKEVGVPEVKLVHHFYVDLDEALTKDTDLDVVISGFTPFGAKGIAWSEPYLEYGLCLIVRADDSIETIQDLGGRVIATYEDEAAVEEVGRMVKGYKALHQFSNGYWDLLANKQIDAFLYDYPFAQAELGVWYAQNPHRAGSLKIAQYNLTDSTYAVGVRKDDTDLLAAVNKAIHDWRASDAYREDVHTYLSSQSLPAAPVAAAADSRTYTVAQGDTLSSIASAQLGNKDRWIDIWAANKDRYPNPNLVERGNVLVLPAQ